MKKIYLFAVIFALIAGFATYFFVNSLQHNSAVTGVEEANVVVALQDIEKDTVVTADMFKVVRLPVSSITYGTLISAADVSGFMTTEKIFKGEQVMAARLTKVGEGTDKMQPGGEYRLSYHLEAGRYAYTISVDDVNAVAHFLRTGDYVNLYAKGAESSTPILKNIQILKCGTYADYKMTLNGAEASASASLITLSLTDKQIETIMQYDSISRVVLVPYAEGAGLTTLPAETTVNENGETVTVVQSIEPATNYGMGEIQTDPPSTTSAE